MNKKMNTKYAVLSLIVIVVIFLLKGFHANYVVKRDIDIVYNEFTVVTNTLSPLFDTYGISMVDSQVKVSHGLISMDEYCDQVKNEMLSQEQRIKEYSDIVKNNETDDDKELFSRATEAHIYVNKMMELCKSKDVDAIHQSLYSGEMYKTIDPITACINRILENKFNNSNEYRKDALLAIERHNDVMIFALILTGILAIAILRCKDCAPKKVVKPRVRVKKK
jgi:hypothetical protein